MHKFFIDNNLPPAMARALHAFSKHTNDQILVEALRDRFNPDEKDINWINTLAREKNWVIISQDRFKKGDKEKEAIRRSGLTVFVLDKQWAKHKYWDKAHNIVRWWPAIMSHAERMRGGSIFRVAWRHGHSAKFEQLTP